MINIFIYQNLIFFEDILDGWWIQEDHSILLDRYRFEGFWGYLSFQYRYHNDFGLGTDISDIYSLNREYTESQELSDICILDIHNSYWKGHNTYKLLM